MTLEEVAAALAPIADRAINPQNELEVVRAGLVLVALLGAIDGEIDQKVLGILSTTARLICEHKTGLHGG